MKNQQNLQMETGICGYKKQRYLAVITLKEFLLCELQNPRYWGCRQKQEKMTAAVKTNTYSVRKLECKVNTYTSCLYQLTCSLVNSDLEIIDTSTEYWKNFNGKGLTVRKPIKCSLLPKLIIKPLKRIISPDFEI